MCPSEFKCAMYVDGELAPDEARELQQHLDTCANCRMLVDALAVENRVLIDVLQDVDLGTAEAPVAGAREHAPTRSDVGKAGVLVLLAASLLRVFMDSISDIPLPSFFEWLNPFRESAQLNLVVNAVIYAVQEGGRMISVVNNLSFIVLNAVILAGALFIFRRSSVTSVLVGLIAATVLLPAPAEAIDLRRNNRVVTVPAGETVDDTVIAMGDTISIDGTVTGDVIALGRHVSVKGAVQGNLIAFAQRVEIEGTVEGSVIGIGQSLQARGQLMRNLYGFGQTIGVGNQTGIGGNAIVFSEETTLEGRIGQDVMAFGERLEARGDISRNLVARAGRVTLLAPARVGGDLTAHVPRTENVQVASGATVVGKTDIKLPERQPSRYLTLGFYIRQLIWLAAAFVTGLILFWLIPTLARVRLDTGLALLKAGGIGFLAAIATPIAAIIVGITLIGLPVALVTLMLWVVGLYLAKIVIAAFLGRALLAGQSEAGPSMPLLLLAGLVLICIAVNIPYVGSFINVLLTLFGFGAILTYIYGRFYVAAD